MRFNPFSRRSSRTEIVSEQGIPPTETAPPKAKTGNTFPADEVVWGVAIRDGFDEIDDPWYHKGTTQHAYLEGNDAVALCGFRPPRSGPRTRRRSRLGLPTAGDHPMCGMCAKMVVAPPPKVPVPIQPGRPMVAVPVTPAPAPVAIPVAPAPMPVATMAPAAPAVPAGQPQATAHAPTPAPQPVVVTAAVPASPAPQPQAHGDPPVSPWVRRNGAAAAEQQQSGTDDLLSRDVDVQAEEKN